jgi:hypothetical protein
MEEPPKYWDNLKKIILVPNADDYSQSRSIEICGIKPSRKSNF